MKNVKKIIFGFVCLVAFGALAQQDPKKSKKDEKAHAEVLKEDSTDPVCKMKVKKGSRIAHTHNGVQYGFCNPGCKETFIKNPEKFVKK